MLSLASSWLQLDRLEQAKVQVNTGSGGAFPCHFDLPAASDARRILTALLYLNPDWADGDGGEVEILPFPLQILPCRPWTDASLCFHLARHCTVCGLSAELRAVFVRSLVWHRSTVARRRAGWLYYRTCRYRHQSLV